MKSYKFDIDDYALYASHIHSEFEWLRKERKKVIILEVLKTHPIYDYRIYIDATGYVRHVKEENLFPIVEDLTTY